MLKFLFNSHFWFLLGFALISGLPPSVRAQGTAFTYQGRLLDQGSPATGSYSLQFTLRSAATNGSVLAGPLVVEPVNVSAGLFLASLDFGDVFSNSLVYLEIGVRTNGSSGSFTILNPAQLLTSTPYAVRASSAANFSGLISDTQLSANIARLDAPQTFSGNVSFANAIGNFQGTLTGNAIGSFTGDGRGLTNIGLANSTNSGTLDPDSLIAIRYHVNDPYQHPPMLLNSWQDNSYDQATEHDFNAHPGAGFIERVDELAASGLMNLGWNTVVIDAGWMGRRDPVTGQMHENAQAWPDGLSNSVRYAHSLGIKVGLWHSLGLTSAVGGGAWQGYFGQVDWYLGYTNMLPVTPTNIAAGATARIHGPSRSTAGATSFHSPLGLVVSYKLSGPGAFTQTFTFDTSTNGANWVTNAILFNTVSQGTNFLSFTNDLPWPPPAFIRLGEVRNLNSGLVLQNLTVTDKYYMWYGNTNYFTDLFPPGFSNEQIVANDARWFASMGIDYVKLEMGTNANYPDSQMAADTRLFVTTMQNAGAIPYLMSAMGLDSAQPWQQGLINAQRFGGYDMPNNSAGINFIFQKFYQNFSWASEHPENSGPGTYISTDILPDGTAAGLQNSMLIMQAMLSSELCITRAVNFPPAYNRNIIAIDQDPAARMAVRLYTNGVTVPVVNSGVTNFWQTTGLTVWKKTLASSYDDLFAVMFLNSSNAPMSFTVTNLATLKIPNFTSAYCLDLTSNVTTLVTSNWTVTVPPQTAYGFKLSCIVPPSVAAGGSGNSLNGALLLPNSPSGPDPASLGANNSTALWTSNGVLYARTTANGTNYFDKQIAP